MRKTAGFTLLEVVVTMIIVGIMASIAGMGIISGVRGYVFAKYNSTLGDKAQLAMSRLNRTFIEVLDITTIASSPARVTYNRLINGVSTQETLYQDTSDNTLKIASGSSTSGGDTLIDNVNSLTLTYKNGSAAWTVGDIKLLSTVQVNLVLTRPDGGSNLTFATVVSPRNNANRGGSTATSTSPNASYGCFVATAAFGQPDHPIVRVLRDFRDRCLLTWPCGRLFVKAYYAYGPYAADLIRGNHWACILTQIFLLPIAGTALLVLYMPQIIPLMVLLAFVMSILISRLVRHGKIFLSRPAGQKGSALLGLIATIVVFAALGAALVSMTSSSSFSQISALASTRAYYVAEGGMRYAASQYRNSSTESAKDTMLQTLHNSDFAMSSDGTFHLEVYPYFFKTTAAVTGGTTLATKFCGGAPSDLTIPTTGYLKIGDNTNPVYYSSRTVAGTTVTFTCASVTATADTTILPVGVASSQTLTNGGNLTLTSGSASFPALNGSFTVGTASSTTGTSAAVYSYKRRSGNVLYGVYQNGSSTTSFSLSVPSGAYITLMKFINLTSKGTYGSGTAYAASRTISYSIPIGYVSSGTSTSSFKDIFSDAADLSTYWNTSAELGDFGVVSGALKVQGTATVYLSSGVWALRTSLLTLNWGAAGVNMNSCWGAMGDNLTYNVQAKIKNTSQYYMAGVVFRVDTSGNMYGCSFLRPNPGNFLGIDYDKIPDDVCPLSATTPMIVLWQEYPTGTYTWLAYKTLTNSSGSGIVSSSGYLVDYSTLLVRIVEATSLQFDTGSGTTFKVGDVVRGATSGVTGIVNGTPILTSGSWGSNAAGWVTIAGPVGTGYYKTATNSSTVNFTSGESLSVNGVYKARYTGTYRMKDNYIRAYYGKPAASGTASSTYTNEYRLANPVLTSSSQDPNWPVDDVSDWAAANDWFTLVQWTAYNSSAGGSIALLGAGTEANAIIRTNTLLTPSSGSFTNPEVGLDTWGSSSTSTYFDDFGLKALGPGQTQGFMPGIQQ